jgi:hypothetical protein
LQVSAVIHLLTEDSRQKRWQKCPERVSTAAVCVSLSADRRCLASAA